MSRLNHSIASELAIRLKALGEDHPDTAESYGNLAYNLAGQGKYAEAVPLLRRSLAIRLKTRGPNHPETAFDENLADIFPIGKRGLPRPSRPIARPWPSDWKAWARSTGSRPPATAILLTTWMRRKARRGPESPDQGGR